MPYVKLVPAGGQFCGICGKRYEFVTSGALSPIPGVVSSRHPAGPCVPLVFDPEPEGEYRPRTGRGGDSPVMLRRVCAWKLCRAHFTTYAPAKKCCSEHCTKAKRRECNRASNLRYWYRCKAAGFTRRRAA